jgi:anthranilate synthase component 2
MSRILILDNYDSFTFNLVHLVEKVSDIPFDVFRNDEIALSEVNKYDKILLSPGPGLPKDAGIMPELIKHYAATKNIFGVCLGLQAIGEAFGGNLKNLENVYHGVGTEITVLTTEPLFGNCPEKFKVGRYHSWVVDSNSLPDCFEITARDAENNIMALSHKKYQIKGVQFHPESILSEYGEEIIRNWLKE